MTYRELIVLYLCVLAIIFTSTGGWAEGVICLTIGTILTVWFRSGSRRLR
jgi:hypothetical protein